MTETFWRRCSSCKSEIAFGAPHWICSVSSCNRKGSSFVFCSVGCWDAHVPVVRHREAWAEEQRTPMSREEPDAPKRTIIRHQPPPGAPAKPASAATKALPQDILVVASKLKAYVRARSGMNTSEGVFTELSDRIRALCDDAIDRAREEGRKTLKDRDF